MKKAILTLTDREKSLFSLYKTFASDPQIREDFCCEWKYISDFLFKDAEDRIPDVLIEMILLWVDSYY